MVSAVSEVDAGYEENGNSNSKSKSNKSTRKVVRKGKYQVILFVNVYFLLLVNNCWVVVWCSINKLGRRSRGINELTIDGSSSNCNRTSMIYYCLFVVLIIEYMVIVYFFFGFSINTFIDGGNNERKEKDGREEKGM